MNERGSPFARRQLVWLAAGVMAVAVGVWTLWDRDTGRADPNDPTQVAAGEQLYALHCARCHGAKLEGQPDWQRRLPNGRLPAPPHDASGHTWHHPDDVLFRITKFGFVPPLAPDGYESDMPAFTGALSDADIWAVLAYIKKSWPATIRARQEKMSEAARQE